MLLADEAFFASTEPLEVDVPRHTSPSNCDCYIDCPNGGYANFIDPDGPCEAGCTGSHFGGSLLMMPPNEMAIATSSGVMNNYPAKGIENFAYFLGFKDIPKVGPESRKLLDTIRGRRQARLNVEWRRIELVTLLRILISEIESAHGW